MDWVLRSPQIHSTFSNLGYVQADGYHINENCNSALQAILYNILSEDKYLRSYRRSVSYGQNIQKDLLPLLINAKEDKTVELVINILVNLTIPTECLLKCDQVAKSEFGRHTIFDINNLLAAAKVAFTELRASKTLVDFLRKNADVGQNEKLSEERRTNVSNCVLLLRNILHIPEQGCITISQRNGTFHSIQNQILWNLFSQGFDKVIIHCMKIPDVRYWGDTLIQLIALMYKDQHVGLLNKLLNLWIDASLSESSEENESNTTPQDRVYSDNSSPMLTSDPTSDSSDTRGGSSGDGDEGENGRDVCPLDASPNNTQLLAQDSIHNEENHQTYKCMDQDSNNDRAKHDQDDSFSRFEKAATSTCNIDNQSQKRVGVPETIGSSDCGYGTQIENQESISTSSNEDDMVTKKPVHLKPHNIKQRPNNKSRLHPPIQDRRRKKIAKRGKANIINVQGLSRETPTDDDISNVLKEFTVDFLLKGYNSLVRSLHNEILNNFSLKIDTSHFFWLVTYFLKFATQIHLDLEHVSSVLSFDIVSYLTSEGVQLCEQFELTLKLGNGDLCSIIRKLHLVVTAIREFVHAVEVYIKISVSKESDSEFLKKLQIKMCETEELKSLFVLLLRHYNPKHHSKMYLQDLIVTNHILLMFLDNATRIPDYSCSTKMIDHIRQFATPEVMAQYGLLLEDYLENGEYVNDCIFTLMHHVSGELGCLITLFQPGILRTFTTIWKTEFELCDDWSDLIEFFINTFVKKTNPCSLAAQLCLEIETNNGKKTSAFVMPQPVDIPAASVKSDKSNADKTEAERWTEDEISALSWNYLQCSTHTDVIGQLRKQLSEDGINKTRDSVIRELLRQNLISQDSHDKQLKDECERTTRDNKVNTERRDEEIRKYCEHLILDCKSNSLEWVQKVLLEVCFTKIQLEKTRLRKAALYEPESKLLNFELFMMKTEELPVITPVAYHALLLKLSVPLVPWNCQQAAICKDLVFLQLLHKLGFQMPVDSGKQFIRIPHFWSPEMLFDVAGRIRPIDMTKLKFSLSELTDIDMRTRKKPQECAVPAPGPTESPFRAGPSGNVYEIHKQRHTVMVNSTPEPGPSHKPDNPEQLNWLQVVKKSNETKAKMNLERCDTAVASDLTCMYVSDDDEKPGLIHIPIVNTAKEKSPRIKVKKARKRRREI